VGCGPGRDTKYFLRKKFEVVGIDLSGGMLKEARKRVPKGKFMKMDVKKLRFKDGSFDGAWSNACLLHITKSQLEATLEELRRVLKRNGLLFVSFKSGNGEGFRGYPDGTRRFFAYYTKEEILRLMKRFKFKILKSYLFYDSDGDTFINIFLRK
jgi:ubiquinone/menaquinone biosynthesis C-methylase UbiE